MKNQWWVWVFVVAIVGVVLFAFNYTGNKESVPLSEIFPEQQSGDTSKIEYEFVENKGKDAASTDAQATAGSTAAQPGAAETAAAAAGTAPSATAPSATGKESKPAVQPAPSATVPTVAKTEPASAPKQMASSPVKSNFSDIPFTIQVSSHKSREQAEIALKGITAAGYPAQIVEINLGDKGKWYRIYVGNFQTKEQANSYMANLKPTYKDSFIISPKSR